MAAIKNVGEGPVQVIIDARNEGGPFTGLEEFCDRVDLRQVNKRALECLIKAGALDRFGLRSQLLAVLDQMVAQSASVHDARDSGQLSMFDLMGGGGRSPRVADQAARHRRDQGQGKADSGRRNCWASIRSATRCCNWTSTSRKVTTCSCAELDERYDGKGVTLAGIIAGVRTINTKKGDQMAFVQLEDLQGACEVGLLPQNLCGVQRQTGRRCRRHRQGQGPDARRARPACWPRLVQTHFDKVVTIGEDPQRYQPALTLAAPTLNGMALENGTGGGNGHENGVSENGQANGSWPPASDGWDDFGAGSGLDSFYGGSYSGAEESPFRNDIPDWLNDGAPPTPVVVDAPVAKPGTPIFAGVGSEVEDEEAGEGIEEDPEEGAALD